MRTIYLILTVAFFVAASVGYLTSAPAVVYTFGTLGVIFTFATNYSFEQHYKTNNFGDF